MTPGITLPTKEIRDMFEDIYPREVDSWLFASYRLGLLTVLVEGTFHMEIPNKDPETVTAFNSGYLDGIALKKRRKDLQKSIPVSTKPTYSYPPTKEYHSPF